MTKAFFRHLASVSLLSLASFVAIPGHAAGNDVPVVVKIAGIPWFTAMEKGIKEAAKDTGLNAYMVGPTTADPAQQVRLVEDLVAKKVKVIAVVPNDAKALEPMFQRAQAAGIPVITHESPDQQGNTWDIEMIDNKQFGELYMQNLAKYMGEEGEYMVVVGGLTVPLHNAWADYAIAYQKEHYPKMKLAADRFGTGESLDETKRVVHDLILAHPKLKGALIYGSSGVVGAAQAVKEAGKKDQIAVIGTCSPSQARKYVMEGIIRESYIWNPVEAGKAIVNLAKLVNAGTPIVDGMDFPGLGKATVDPQKRVIRVIKLQPINKDTVAELAALGL
ncbi:MAG TPA: substrate-binding domain-containing protein [Chthoniobacterales bacterium]